MSEHRARYRVGRAVLLLLAVAALAGGGATVTYAEGDTAEAVAADDTVEFSLTELTPILDFLTLVKKEVGIPLFWDEKARALQHKEVTPGLHFRGSREDAFRIVRSLLTAYELVLVPIGEGANRKYFVADMRASQAILRLKPEYVVLNDDNLAELETQDGLFVATTLQVKNLEDLRAVRNALSRILSGMNIGTITEVPAARSFVITDFAPKAVAAYRLLKEMDVPAQQSEEEKGREVIFQAIHLEHAPAEEVADLLQQHFGIAPPPPQRGARAAPSRRGPPAHALPSGAPLRIDADFRLNLLLVTGMRWVVAKVSEVVASVDRPRPRTPVQVLVVPLAHVDANRAAAALNALIHRAPSAWLADGGTQDLPVVAAHQETNILLIQADEAAAQALRRTVREMDQPPEQE